MHDRRDFRSALRWNPQADSTDTLALQVRMVDLELKYTTDPKTRLALESWKSRCEDEIKRRDTP